MPPKLETGNPEIFFNRELSWIEFNRRVLDEAFPPSNNPILERLKFLCITEGNLDEFYMVRVAGLRNLKSSGVEERGVDGRTTSEVLLEIASHVKDFVSDQYKALELITKELADNKIYIVQSAEELTKEEVKYIGNYYHREVSSILTPLAIDVSHPFPHILNKTLNLAITLQNEDKNAKRDLFAVVQVPSVIPRFLQLPSHGEERRYFSLEEIIKLHLSDLFYGMKVKEIHAFRIIRDADIMINDEEKISDLLTSMKNELKNRMWGEAVRLDIAQGSKGVKETLRMLLGLEEWEVYEIPSFSNLMDMMYFQGLDRTSHLKFTYNAPKHGFANVSLDKIFSNIRKGDVLHHHPYESFKSIEDLLKKAKDDPKVLAIKMTLYRTSGDAPILQYLGEAAENGKQVTVLVELKARFDEERNIRWAKRLEDSGVHVVYGFVGLKIHCKMLLIVRKEEDSLKRYVHLGTGNYNPTTAKFYTDLSLFTCDPDITEDVATLFNVITSSANMSRLRKIFAAPLYLKEEFLRLIRRETANAREGKPARILFKMNSLVDPDVILAMYEASNSGVQIDLIIRGVCCLRPGVPGVSENIGVRSIIGRYLEHSRIYYFENAGNPDIYLASADCMPRNFIRRIEVMFPILDKRNQKKITDIMDYYLRDNTTARVINSEGIYERLTPPSSEKAVNSQVDLASLYT